MAVARQSEAGQSVNGEIGTGTRGFAGEQRSTDIDIEVQELA